MRGIYFRKLLGEAWKGTLHDVVGETHRQRLMRALVAVAGIVLPYFYVKWINHSSQVFLDAMKSWLIATGVLLTVTALVFAYRFFLEGPYHLWLEQDDMLNPNREFNEAFDRTAEQMSLSEPIRDRVAVMEATLFMTFGDWEHSMGDLSDVDQLTVIPTQLKAMEQDACDNQLTIWIRRTRHGGKHIDPGPSYWATHHINWVREHGAVSAWPDHGGSLTQGFEPQVRKTDVEQLYGQRYQMLII